MKIKPSKSRVIFQIFNYFLMLLATFICVYPFWYIVIYTFSDSTKAGINSPVFLPRGFSVSNYIDIFKLNGFFPALGISVLRTLLGTVWPYWSVLFWDICSQRRKCRAGR